MTKKQPGGGIIGHLRRFLEFVLTLAPEPLRIPLGLIFAFLLAVLVLCIAAPRIPEIALEWVFISFAAVVLVAGTTAVIYFARYIFTAWSPGGGTAPTQPDGAA